MYCTLTVSQDKVPKPAGSGQVRNLVVKDTTGEIHDALWNEKATQDVKSGDTVRMTHMSARYNSYLKMIALTSTKQTALEVQYLTTFSLLLINC